MHGLYTSNPQAHPQAKKIDVVHSLKDVDTFASGASGDGWGRGGMRTKLDAVRIAHEAGIPVLIAHGRTPLLDLLTTPQLGTLFIPPSNTRHPLHQQWPISGRLIIDRLGWTTLSQNQGDLSLAQIISSEGHFFRGDLVELYCPSERGWARGLCAYGDEELKRAQGQDDDQAKVTLGEAYDGPAIMRGDWVSSVS